MGPQALTKNQGNVPDVLTPATWAQQLLRTYIVGLLLVRCAAVSATDRDPATDATTDPADGS